MKQDLLIKETLFTIYVRFSLFRFCSGNTALKIYEWIVSIVAYNM